MMDVTSLDIKIPQFFLICGMFWLTNSDMVSDVYLPCIEGFDFDQFNITEEQSIDHPTSDGIITLYHSETGVTWCEAYRTCRNMSSNMFVIPSQDVQDVMSYFNSTNGTARAWIAGTRKKHGLNWTWVNESLTDCVDNACSFLNVEEGEFGAVLKSSSNELFSTDIFDATRTGYCGSGFLTDSKLSWYDKQLQCFEDDSQLATLEDALSRPPRSTHTIGLQFHPWLWLRDNDLHPVIYTSWAPGDRLPAWKADCLGIELNATSQGAWNEHNCSERLPYFLCEDVPVTLTTWTPHVESTVGSTQPDESEISTELPEQPETDSTTESTADTTSAGPGDGVPLEYWLPPVLVAVVLIIVVPTAVVTSRKRRNKASADIKQSKQMAYKKTDNDPDEGGEVSGPDTAIVIPANNQLGSNAYAMEASQYAEIGSNPSGQEKPARHGQTVKQQNLYSTASDINPYSISATTNTYPDRTSIPNQSVPGNQTIYSQVTRPEENDTVLVDNQQYSSFGVVHGGKNSVPSEPLVDMNGAITVQVDSDNPDQTSFSIPRPQLKSEP